MTHSSFVPLSFVLATIVVGCGDDMLPPVIEESPHLVLRAPSDLAVCSGTFSYMESEVILIRLLFGGGPTPVDYAWMPASHFGPDEFLCLSTDYGCAVEQNVYSRTLAHTHELVHAARDSIPSVLEEGLASVLSIPFHSSVDILAPRGDLWGAFEVGWPNVALTVGLYDRAAHFVSFLIASGGFDKLVMFEARLRTLHGSYDASFGQWRIIYEEVYGESFDEAWVAYESYPDCSPPQFHRPLSACAALEGVTPEATLTPAFLTDPGPKATFERKLDCGQDSAYGPIVVGDQQSVASLHVVELDNPLAMSVVVSLVGDSKDGSRVLLTNCGNCWSGAGVIVSHDEPNVLVNIESGTYALVLEQALESAGEVGIELTYY